jgi:hypothetical protein
MVPAGLCFKLKKWSAEQSRPLHEIIVKPLFGLFLDLRKSNRNRLIQLLTTPIEGASAEDYKEYEYDDI